MTGWLVGALAAIVALLAGLLSSKTRRLRDTLDELEAERKAAERRREEAEVLRNVVEDVSRIGAEEGPAEVPPPAGGDVDSRLDRLGRLHEH